MVEYGSTYNGYQLLRSCYYEKSVLGYPSVSHRNRYIACQAHAGLDASTSLKMQTQFKEGGELETNLKNG